VRDLVAAEERGQALAFDVRASPVGEAPLPRRRLLMQRAWPTRIKLFVGEARTLARDGARLLDDRSADIDRVEAPASAV
jgi:hypothetical protein